MKRFISGGLFSLGLMFVGACSAGAMELSGDITEKTLLTENTKLSGNVKLDRVLQVPSGKKITLDLNGYKISASDFSSDEYYAIENNGDLTIIDSGSPKGEISCTKSSSSCIRNTGTITMNGINVSSTWLTFKNEYSGVASIINSNISSSDSSLDGGTIFNYGNLTVNNSKVTMDSKNSAIYAANSWDTGVRKTSKTVLKNSTLSSKSSKTISIPRGASSDNVGDELIIDSVTLEGGLDIGNNTKTTVSGDVKTTYLATTRLLTNATKGTVVTLINGSSVYHKLNDNGTIPSGVTLKISDGIKLKINNPYTLDVLGKVEFEGTSKYTLAGSKSVFAAKVYNKSQNSYYGSLEATLDDANVDDEIELLDDSIDTTIKSGSLILKKNEDGDGYSVIKVKEETPSVDMDNSISDSTSKKEEIKNPETNDNMVLYVILSGVSLGGICYGVRKLRKSYN